MEEKKEHISVRILFFTPILFILIIGILFKFVKIMSENKILAGIISGFIGIILLFLYLKLVKFSKINPINSTDYKRLLKEKKKYKEKTDKKENRIPLASTKKLKELIEEGDKLNKEFFKGTLFFKNYFGFVLFSLYFGGACMERPFWAIKVIRMVTKQIYINWKEGRKSNLGWRKVFDKKQQDYIYYGFENSYQKNHNSFN
jgi:hypothetical protein